MTKSQWGYTPNSHFFDIRFLNPFERTINGTFYGNRGGNIQFIYIVCALISLLSIFIYSNNKSKLPLQFIFLCISYFAMYYNISCLLIPNEHQRCTSMAWMFLLSVIMSTILTIFGESLFKNINKLLNKKKNIKGGTQCYRNKHKNKHKNKNKNKKEKEKEKEKEKKQNGGGVDYTNKYRTDCEVGSQCYNDKYCEIGSQCYNELQYGIKYHLYNHFKDNVDNGLIAGVCNTPVTNECGGDDIFQLYSLNILSQTVRDTIHIFTLTPLDSSKINVEYDDMLWITTINPTVSEGVEETVAETVTAEDKVAEKKGGNLYGESHLLNCADEVMSRNNADRTKYEDNSDKYKGSLFKIISPIKTTGQVMKNDTFYLKLQNGKYIGKGRNGSGCGGGVIKYRVSASTDFNNTNNLWSLSTLEIKPQLSEPIMEELGLKNIYKINDLRYLMWEQNPAQKGVVVPLKRGYLGYITIKFGEFWAINYNGVNDTITYAISPDTTREDYKPYFPLGNSKHPESHIWRVEYIPRENAYRISSKSDNTIHLSSHSQEEFDPEVQKLASIPYTNPLVIFEKTGDDWTLFLKENNKQIIFGQYSELDVASKLGYVSVEKIDPPIDLTVENSTPPIDLTAENSTPPIDLTAENSTPPSEKSTDKFLEITTATIDFDVSKFSNLTENQDVNESSNLKNNPGVNEPSVLIENPFSINDVRYNLWEINSTTTLERGHFGYIRITPSHINKNWMVYNEGAVSDDKPSTDVSTYIGDTSKKPYKAKYGADWHIGHFSPGERTLMKTTFVHSNIPYYFRNQWDIKPLMGSCGMSKVCKSNFAVGTYKPYNSYVTETPDWSTWIFKKKDNPDSDEPLYFNDIVTIQLKHLESRVDSYLVICGNSSCSGQLAVSVGRKGGFYDDGYWKIMSSEGKSGLIGLTDKIKLFNLGGLHITKSGVYFLNTCWWTSDCGRNPYYQVTAVKNDHKDAGLDTSNWTLSTNIDAVHSNTPYYFRNQSDIKSFMGSCGKSKICKSNKAVGTYKPYDSYVTKNPDSSTWIFKKKNNPNADEPLYFNDIVTIQLKKIESRVDSYLIRCGYSTCGRQLAVSVGRKGDNSDDGYWKIVSPEGKTGLIGLIDKIKLLNLWGESYYLNTCDKTSDCGKNPYYQVTVVKKSHEDAGKNTSNWTLSKTIDPTVLKTTDDAEVVAKPAIKAAKTMLSQNSTKTEMAFASVYAISYDSLKKSFIIENAKYANNYLPNSSTPISLTIEFNKEKNGYVMTDLVKNKVVYAQSTSKSKKNDYGYLSLSDDVSNLSNNEQFFQFEFLKTKIIINPYETKEKALSHITGKLLNGLVDYKNNIRDFKKKYNDIFMKSEIIEGLRDITDKDSIFVYPPILSNFDTFLTNLYALRDTFNTDVIWNENDIINASSENELWSEHNEIIDELRIRYSSNGANTNYTDRDLDYLTIPTLSFTGSIESHIGQINKWIKGVNLIFNNPRPIEFKTTTAFGKIAVPQDSVTIAAFAEKKAAIKVMNKAEKDLDVVVKAKNATKKVAIAAKKAVVEARGKVNAVVGKPMFAYSQEQGKVKISGDFRRMGGEVEESTKNILVAMAANHKRKHWNSIGFWVGMSSTGKYVHTYLGWVNESNGEILGSTFSKPSQWGHKASWYFPFSYELWDKMRTLFNKNKDIYKQKILDANRIIPTLRTQLVDLIEKMEKLKIEIIMYNESQNITEGMAQE